MSIQASSLNSFPVPLRSLLIYYTPDGARRILWNTDMKAEVLTEELRPVVQGDTHSSNLKIPSIVFVCIKFITNRCQRANCPQV